MGLLSRMLAPVDVGPLPAQVSSWLSDHWALGGQNEAGVNVTPHTGRSIPGVLACTNIIAEALASYTGLVFQRMASGKRPAPEHPLYSILNGPPNPQMTRFSFWYAIICQALLWGDGYALIQRDGANRARALWPLPSDRTYARRVEGVLEYVTTATASGQEWRIQPADVLHIPYLAFDGLKGYSPITLRRQGLGLSAAAEKWGARLFGKSARPSGLLTVPVGVSIGLPAQERMKRSFEQMTSGENALGLALMEEGITFQPLMVNPIDAQFLETRKYQIEEMARDYGIPAFMLGIREPTHANSEQLKLQFDTNTMLRWVIRSEEEVNRKLFGQGPFFYKKDMNTGMRADFATLSGGYQKLVQSGLVAINEGRHALDMNPIGDDDGGNMNMVQVNMVSLKVLKQQETNPATAGALIDAPTGKPGGGEDDDDPADVPKGSKAGVRQVAAGSERYAMAFAGLFSDAVGRTVNREKRDAAWVQRTWLPTLTALDQSIAAERGGEVPEGFLKGYCDTLAVRCASWSKLQAAEIADYEFSRAYSALVARE